MSTLARVTFVVLGPSGADTSHLLRALDQQTCDRSRISVRLALGGAEEINSALAAIDTEFTGFVDVRDSVGPDFATRLLDRLSRYTLTLAAPAESTSAAGWVDPEAKKREALTYTLDKAVPSLWSLAGVAIPSAWFASVSYGATVGAWADALFLAECLARYARAGVVVDATPSLVPGTYTRAYDRASAGRTDLGLILETARQLDRRFGDPEDAPAFAALLREELKSAAARQILESPTESRHDIDSSGISDFTRESLLGRWNLGGIQPWTLYRLHQRTVVVVMLNVNKYRASAWIVDGLVQLGAKVELLYLYGHISAEDFNPKVTYRRLNSVGVARGSGYRRTLYQVIRRLRALRQKLARGQKQDAIIARHVLRFDEHARWLSRHAFVRLGLDRGGLALAAGMSAATPRDVDAVTRLEPRIYLLLAASLHPGGADALMPAIPKATRELADRAVRAPLDVGSFVAVLAKFIAGAKPFESRVMVDAAVRMYEGHDDSLLLRIWQRAMQVRANEHSGDLSDGLVDEAVRRADEELRKYEYARALWLAEAVCNIVFAATVNTANEESPLFIDPDSHLAALRGSAVWQALTDPLTEPRLASRRVARTDTRVAISSGPYPRFTAPVADVLRRSASVVHLKATGVYHAHKYLDVDSATLTHRLAAALGGRLTWDAALVEQIQSADVVFCDWADKTAVMASLVAPAGSRVVIRMHGADAISTWVHLIDWSRVDDLIFVSQHLQSLVQDILGDRLASVRMHVIPNVIAADRFALPKLPVAGRTLGLVGWGQKVKDAVFAVEILARLRKSDPEWRLVLFGNDFPPKRADESEYARVFRQRAGEDDVRDAIVYAGYVEDLPNAFQGIGYGLSTSLRESFPVGLLEMAASGAIPVVRAWPMYGARGRVEESLPAHWFVDSVDEAVARIQREGVDFARNSAAIIDEVGSLYGRDVVETAYERAVFGCS